MTDRQPNERDQHEQHEQHDVHGPGTAGAWQPVPGGGDYDPDQTMHVSFAAQLPPEPRPGEDPLGAHGPAGPGWNGRPAGDAGYLDDGGYQVGQPLFGPGPDDPAAYAYPPQEQPGPQGGDPGRPYAGHERPYEHAGHAGHLDPAGGYGGFGGGQDDAGGGPFPGHDAGPGDPGPGDGGSGEPSGGAPDPATTWSIPVIREESEAESGEYSLGAFSPAWDQTPSPAPTHSFPAAMFGQGAAAAAQAAQERAAAERARGGADDAPSDGGSGHWEMPFTGPEGGDAVPWLPAHAPAADAAWSGIVDDPEAPPPAPTGEGAAQDRPGGHDGAATGEHPYGVQDPSAGHDGAAAGDLQDYGVPRFDEAAAAEPAGGPEGYDVLPDPAGPDGAERPAPQDGADLPDGPEEPRQDGGPDPAADQAAAPVPGTVEAVDASDPADPVEAVDGDAPADDAQPGDLAPGDGTGTVQDGDGATDFGSDGAGAAEPDPAAPDVAPGPEEAFEPAAETRSEHPLASYMLRVNGTDRPVTDAWLGESLLYVLRERLGLAGAKDGCEQGECGACSVQVDGRLVASCLVPAATAAGSEVRTVEGLTVDGRPSDVQCALADSGAVQCGFCIPGMAMTVHDLLEGNHRPTDLDIRQALSGNLCRCSGYRGVLDAVRSVVAARDTGRDPDDQGAAGSDDPARIPHQGGPATSGGDR
ncbi:hypothetical protein RVR_3484 [Actinacidiphila reveromycinica]|uniref:2Fe-2S ferredoxin-type domain-containing protein n=1 Tax=Actinacidiphila reveromycinica TaxID=659352 RepID=A0A7U3URZ6_9ACTN|nr:(2Fe-2S)-binding protein [Streptomyces sp. SN-593]BBA97645.1 hypothetical protein RVR_3484 [Streptomyces sp. SN-593]